MTNGALPGATSSGDGIPASLHGSCLALHVREKARKWWLSVHRHEATALPALYPDVAIIHVHRCDIYGNAQIDGITVADFDVARAAKRVILSTERIVPTDLIREDSGKTIITHFCVDAVCEVRYGSYPGNMPYEYFSDEAHLKEWLANDAKPETLQPFLAKYIYGTRNFEEYLALCGGEEKMAALRRQEFLESTVEGGESGVRA